jgi:hypothetical protein
MTVDEELEAASAKLHELHGTLGHPKEGLPELTFDVVNHAEANVVVRHWTTQRATGDRQLAPPDSYPKPIRVEAEARAATEDHVMRFLQWTAGMRRWELARTQPGLDKEAHLEAGKELMDHGQALLDERPRLAQRIEAANEARRQA